MTVKADTRDVQYFANTVSLTLRCISLIENEKPDLPRWRSFAIYARAQSMKVGIFGTLMSYHKESLLSFSKLQ